MDLATDISATAPGTAGNELGPGSRVVVGLSGGVDSSVSALLLRNQGYDVQAVFMKNWEEDDREGHCSAQEDLADAATVCKVLGIPLHTVNLSSDYWDRVFTHFLDELNAGRTPNPDVVCNREIKFRAFLDHALTLGARGIVTGHYARVRPWKGGHQLLKGRDELKDQSYFLHLLDQSQLAQTLFPLGELKKAEVRHFAHQAGLPTYDKRDSTGICFIGERPFKAFLGRYFPAQSGPIETPEGRWLGTHDGLMYYTRGQRYGLGIGGQRGAQDAPWYVATKDPQRNALIVVQGRNHPLLYSQALVTGNIHWIAGEPPSFPLACHAKIRYRQTDQFCEVAETSDGGVRVQFPTAQWAVTPGQSVVFYQGDVCLGGGVIQEAASPRMQ